MAWPASHIALISAYLSIEPTAEDRIEYGIAQHSAMFVNSNSAKGAESRKMKDFLLFHDVWNKQAPIDPTRYNEADRAALAALDKL